METKYSFVTFLGTDSFLPGVLALNQSLKTYNTRYQLMVLITDLVSPAYLEILKQKKIEYKRIEVIQNPHQLINDERNFKHMFTKLRIFELVEFDKVVYLDADMLICQNIDVLFNMPHMSAVVAGGLYPGNESWKDFNAGFLVVEPDKALFDTLCSSMNYLPSDDGGDQGFLHAFYKDWTSDESLHLDHKFNVPSGYIDEYCKLPNYNFCYKRRLLATNISIIHYWGRYKPWEIDTKLLKRKSDIKWEQSLILWWDVFAEVVKDVVI
ncbi:MAG TPA: glycosyltransferase [Mucilaginibacter sp.]|jgi:glycogenin glucosyltransferase|nr:glycosyltransferase [Mucilaginibacter sp.]